MASHAPRSADPKLDLWPGDQLVLRGPRMDFVLRPVATRSGQARLREVVIHPGAVIILPIAPDGRIVMIRNQRHTVHEELYELPAGTLEAGGTEGGGEKGEGGDDAAIEEKAGASSQKPVDGRAPDPLACAAKELMEETGYRAAKIEPFGWFYTSPGVLTEKMYCFIATGLTPGPQALEDNERIRVELVTRAEVLDLIRRNLLVDAKSIATVLKYLMVA